MIDVKTIWQVPVYLPYLQPVLADGILKDAESKIGYNLPIEYIELLRVQNGGYIRFTIEETGHHQIFGIGPHYPSITDMDLNDFEGCVSYEIKGLVPFDGDGHWYLCFDYRNNKTEPEIIFIDTELDREKTIAKNFKEYLSQLVLESGGNFIIETELPIQNVIKNISKDLKIQFEEPNSYDYGYPVYRARFNESWIWISPNSVNNGFVRIDDKRYEELKNLVNGHSLRYPEIPAESLLIVFSEDEVRVSVHKILKEHSYLIKPLNELI
jgi:SMI1-KNR4 cell-wall